MEKIIRVVALIKERLYFVNDLWSQSYYFFERPTEYNEQVIKKRWKEGTAEHLMHIADLLISTVPFDKTIAHDKVMDYIRGNELNMGQIMNSFRLTLVGDAKGPDLFEIIDILGVEETVIRLKNGIDTISKLVN